MQWLQTVDLRIYGLLEVNLLEKKSRGTNMWVQECLYRGLATQRWKNLFPSAHIKVFDIFTSDRLPLVL